MNNSGTAHWNSSRNCFFCIFIIHPHFFLSLSLSYLCFFPHF
jgi:hypothetical protein